MEKRERGGLRAQIRLGAVKAHTCAHMVLSRRSPGTPLQTEWIRVEGRSKSLGSPGGQRRNLEKRRKTRRDNKLATTTRVQLPFSLSRSSPLPKNTSSRAAYFGGQLRGIRDERGGSQLLRIGLRIGKPSRPLRERGEEGLACLLASLSQIIEAKDSPPFLAS